MGFNAIFDVLSRIFEFDLGIVLNDFILFGMRLDVVL